MKTSNCCERLAYLSLDHLYSFSSHASQELINIDIFLMLHSLKHGVKDNEGACPAHTSTAVDQHWRTSFVIARPDATYEADERGRKLWHTVIRPTEEVVVRDSQWRGLRIRGLQRRQEREGGRGGEGREREGRDGGRDKERESYFITPCSHQYTYLHL